MQARHLILERLRGQAKQNDAVTSALEAAMLQCASAQQEAAACLGLVHSNGTSDARGDSNGANDANKGDDTSGRVPMDVVDEDGVGGGRGGIGVDEVASGTTTTVGAGVGKGSVGAEGKGKLRAVEQLAGVGGGNGR